MTLPGLISEYGYWAVLGGTLLEGESILLLAGFAAHRGYLDLHWAIGVAVLGGFLGDQAFFFAGRHWGPGMLARFPKYAAPAAKAKALLEKYDIPVILGVRFMYGLRIVLPFTIGMSGVPVLRFQLLNLAGAALWAGSGVSLGYLLGHAAERVLGDLHAYEGWLAGALVVAGIGWWLWSRRRARS